MLISRLAHSIDERPCHDSTKWEGGTFLNLFSHSYSYSSYWINMKSITPLFFLQKCNACIYRKHADVSAGRPGTFVHQMIRIDSFTNFSQAYHWPLPMIICPFRVNSIYSAYRYDLQLVGYCSPLRYCCQDLLFFGWFIYLTFNYMRWFNRLSFL